MKCHIDTKPSNEIKKAVKLILKLTCGKCPADFFNKVIWVNKGDDLDFEGIDNHGYLGCECCKGHNFEELCWTCYIETGKKFWDESIN